MRAGELALVVEADCSCEKTCGQHGEPPEAEAA
jgi:hypothetical protein